MNNNLILYVLWDLDYTGVTILLSLTVFHNLVAETLPQVSDALPVLGTQNSNNFFASTHEYVFG